ncbi:MAG: PhoH family protein [Gemmatimonadota bacterium]|nr:MAG: PhoH family protein [Gemmatimonadota bacterium]
MSETISETFSLDGIDPLLFYGANDAHLLLIEEAFQTKIAARGDTIRITGNATDVMGVLCLFEHLSELVLKGKHLHKKDVKALIDMVRDNTGEESPDPATNTIVVSTKKECIRPRSRGQKLYVQAVKQYDVVFAIGPAGTGKTYLAVAMAVAALKKEDVRRIILARPAVEAGETLGFLPGDLKEKIDPYLRPIYDALYEMIPPLKLKKLIDEKIIEIVPLAYMRGRTLNNAYVILDEAQNSTLMQMKMFLTRLGVRSKAIITGDITQVDLPEHKISGLIQIQHILSELQGVKFIYLTEKDVVRHILVQEIIKAFKEYEQNRLNSDTAQSVEKVKDVTLAQEG